VDQHHEQQHEGNGQPRHSYRPGDKVNLDAIPEELRKLGRWVCWQNDTRGGKLTKVPKDPKHPPRNAAVDDPMTWGTFEQAVKTYNHGRMRGIGLVLVAGDDLIVFDLDHCRDAETGVIEAWAMNIINTLSSYTEISPSGTGIHIFVRGSVPGKRRRKGQVEVYESGRYMTVTGWTLEGSRS
jgi:primase-polymerase (primpol)-like protein